MLKILAPSRKPIPSKRDGRHQKSSTLTFLSVNNNIITIEIGKHSFYVFKHLLVKQSAYFREEIGDSAHLRLGDDFTERDIFELYVKYLYSGKIHCKIDDGGTDDGGSSNGKEYELLCGLFVFAEKVQDVSTQNAVMDALLCKYDSVDDQDQHWLPPDNVVAEVYSWISEGSPIRRFLVDVCTWASEPKLLMENSDNLPKDFLLELAAHLLGKHVETRHSLDIPAGTKSCDYHKHAEGTECTTRKRKREAEQVARVARARVDTESNAVPTPQAQQTTFPPSQAQPTTIPPPQPQQFQGHLPQSHPSQTPFQPPSQYQPGHFPSPHPAQTSPRPTQNTLQPSSQYQPGHSAAPRPVQGPSLPPDFQRSS